MSRGLTSRRVRERPAPLIVDASACACECLSPCSVCNIRSSKRNKTPIEQVRGQVNSSPASPGQLVITRDRQAVESYCATRLYCGATQTFDRTLRSTDFRSASSRSASCDKALSIPEIVENIIRLLDDDLWQARTLLAARKPPATISLTSNSGLAGVLSNCLYVNRTFQWATMRVMSRRLEIGQFEQFQAYAKSTAGSDNLCRDLLLHRLKTCSQEIFESLHQHRLTSLELYVCPQLRPSTEMLVSGTLRKLALPGCGLVDDNSMTLVARYCRRLSILDLRACELVSDYGITLIAENCPELTYLNVGRVKNACAITDRSIIKISEYTAIETLGLAGCAIGDESVIAIAKNRGVQLERLSMNQCANISDISIKILLKSSPHLQVLELVGCMHVRDVLMLCDFKLRTGALIETSESMAQAMKVMERDVKQKIQCLQSAVSRRV